MYFLLCRVMFHSDWHWLIGTPINSFWICVFQGLFDESHDNSCHSRPLCYRNSAFYNSSQKLLEMQMLAAEQNCRRKCDPYLKKSTIDLLRCVNLSMLVFSPTKVVDSGVLPVTKLSENTSNTTLTRNSLSIQNSILIMSFHLSLWNLGKKACLI